MPGVSQHDKPNHARHQGVINDDKDCDARQSFRGPAENRTISDRSWLALVANTRPGLAHSRGLAEPHGVVALAHDLFARAVQELGQPADAAHKETGVDVEENDGRVAVGVLPVGKKRGLNRDGREARDETTSVGNNFILLTNRSRPSRMFMSHQREEGAEKSDGAKVSDVGVHVVVLLFGE